MRQILKIFTVLILAVVLYVSSSEFASANPRPIITSSITAIHVTSSEANLFSLTDEIKVEEKH